MMWLRVGLARARLGGATGFEARKWRSLASIVVAELKLQQPVDEFTYPRLYPFIPFSSV